MTGQHETSMKTKGEIRCSGRHFLPRIATSDLKCLSHL